MAERECPQEVLEDEGAIDGAMWSWTPPLAPLPKRPTLAFALILSLHDRVAQVERLLSRILAPEHAYVVRIDAKPWSANADALVDAVKGLAAAHGALERTFIITDQDMVALSASAGKQMFQK